jgi:hypothetical protein
MQHIYDLTREENPHLVAVAKAVPAMAERLRTTAATAEAGNAATVTALADLRAELAEVKASLQDFVQGRFSFTFTPARSRMLPQGWDPLLSQRQGRPVSPPSPSLRGRPPPDATAYLRACGGRLAYSASAGVSRGTAAARSPRAVC